MKYGMYRRTIGYHSNSQASC